MDIKTLSTKTIRTAEYVSPKHPDKMCDRVSDAILDYVLSIDPKARVAIEVVGGHGQVDIYGEVSTSFHIKDLKNKAIKIASEITGVGIESVYANIISQSVDIARGVDIGGAGDQGIMVGYAVNNENTNYLPVEYYLARSLNHFLYARLPEDGKTQVTVDKNSKIKSIVVSWGNAKSKLLDSLLFCWLAENGLADRKEIDKLDIHINPAGDWNITGFDADTGLTGRKLAVDNYGPQIPIGGGAFSGKDATKVDRSAAYQARRLAVALAKRFSKPGDEVMVKVAYAIGVVEPVMITATINGKPFDLKANEGVVDLSDPKYEASQALYDYFDFTPRGMIEQLELDKPQYEVLASYGHFGRSDTIWG